MNKIIKVSLVTILLSSMTLTQAMFEREKGYWTNPSDESKKDFFGKLTDPKSQRENWYTVSPYIAEFWCAVSNVGFIYVGIKNESPELVFAGMASIVSHSIPKQWLLKVDKLGVAVVFSKVIREREVLKSNPILMAPLALAGTINAADAYLARNKGYTPLHVIWHLSSALFAHGFLQYIKQ